ncbi:hypothetical protein [Methylacidiphilum caldifontis]|uniref:Uncharacterized protein n=1 Tax=Methylacidiphilum caldifontis TaxID=2795386 RepID=A0A4Y8PHC7_9BACT|nr:hypothetical protein [Methylacidiphilum caldifontis]QSR89541.1 hypothetical protein IT6_04510 [Methylacidiphilum caldifontis]TFE71115.1 hypothetical protein A7Q10_05085 [Methylacidiphilum caldifontis]
MKIGLVSCLLSLLPLSVDKAFSCGICSVPNSNATRGMLPAVLFLLALLGLVFGLFISFFVKMSKKEAALNSENSCLQDCKTEESNAELNVERG